MESQNDLNQVALDTFSQRITHIIPMQIRECVEQLDEEQLWWRPNEQANSVGNLVLHVSGSTRHYLSHLLGGLDYTRNRPAEFAERGPVPKTQLLSNFDQVISEAAQVLSSFDTSRFLNPTTEPGYYATIFEQLLGISIHLATHAGQVVYITKMLKAGTLDELWIRAHKK
jgi:uncharacterized damage-inducible protein DinB